MSDEPKNHCVVVETAISSEGIKRREHVTHYKNVSHPAHLPEVLLADGDREIDEWAAWKKWYVDRAVKEAKESWGERRRRTRPWLDWFKPAIFLEGDSE